MTDLPTTARYLLPLLASAQAQKEVTHNEALTLLDLLIAPAIEDGPQDDPPAEPAVGQCWLVGPEPGGAWAGMEDSLALWTAGGWRFVAPRPGLRAWRVADGSWLAFGGEGWAEPGVVPGAAGGSVIDAEARAVIDALILNLSAQGLLIAG